MDYLGSSTPLYQNFTNRLHSIAGVRTDRPFLLFNMSINYGVAIGARAGEAALAARDGATPAQIAERLAVRPEAILPLFERLLALGFLSLVPTESQRSWVPEGHDIVEAADYPFADIIVSLGDRCNLACSYCFNAGQREERLAQGEAVRRLSRVDIDAITGQFAALGGKGVIFTGGEPTLNPEIVEICEDAAAHGLSVKLITNGTRLDRLDHARLAMAVDVLAVSLDSLDDATNAALWRVGKYKVERTLEQLAQIGRIVRPDGKQTLISLKPTVTAKNVGQIGDLLLGCVDRLEGCRLGFDMTAYHPIGKPEIDAELRVSAAAIEHGLAEAARAMMRRSGVALDAEAMDAIASAFALSIGGKVETAAEPIVLSCTPSLFVTNGGDLYPCQALELPEFHLGSVYGEGLAAGFDRPRFRALRREMTRDAIEMCRECDFRFVCTEHCHGDALKLKGATNAFLNGDARKCRARVAKRLWIETQRMDGRTAPAEAEAEPA